MNEITKAEIRKRLGNITQLQELLLGDKIDEYNYKLQEFQQRIDALTDKLDDSQATIKQQLDRLESKLLGKIESAIKNTEQIQEYDRSQAQIQQHELQQAIETISEYSHENIDFLRQKINANTNSLKLEISQSKSDLDRDLSLVRQQVLNQLEHSLARLASNKISRTELAEVLFNLCLELKETDRNRDSSPVEQAETSSIANTDLVDSDAEL